MQTGRTDTTTHEVRISAPAETIFAFLVDPQKMLRWKGVEATLEPVPGDAYRVNVTGTAIAVGEYVSIEPPNRDVFMLGVGR